MRTVHQLRCVKAGFQLRFPVFMANITKILLSRDEIELACYLAAFYVIQLDQSLVDEAIEFRRYDWLKYVFAFGKNYVVRDKQPEKLDYKLLFHYIDKHYDQEPDGARKTQDDLEEICQWYLSTEGKDDKEKDNILSALLSKIQDPLTIKFMGKYSEFLQDESLFLFSLDNNSTRFIKESLLMGAYDKQIFKKEEVIMRLLEFMKQGSKTVFILNTLILADITVWKNKHLIMLIDMFRNFTEGAFEENRLLVCYNPLLCIALSAELLTKIANSRKKFTNECNGLKARLLALGKMYNSKIDDETYFEDLILDKDFSNRSVLQIITECQLEALLSEEDTKSENIIQTIYIGKDSKLCDGNMYGFSNCLHILSEEPKVSKDSDFEGILKSDFNYKLGVDYSFQHRYRKKSIFFFFVKDMIQGFLICLTTMLIYFDYLQKFRGEDVYFRQQPMPDGTLKFTVCNDESEAEKCFGNPNYGFEALEIRSDIEAYLFDRDNHMKNNFAKFKSWAFYQYGISFVLLLSFIFRQIFNLCRAPGVNRLTFNKQLNIDVVFASAGALVFAYITELKDYKIMLDEEGKNTLDFMVALVLTLSWIRFFMLFLVVPNVSNMLLTLIKMMLDVCPFLFIMLVYIVLSAQIFTTQYQDINTGSYGEIGASLRTTYDQAMAVYTYVGASDQEILFSIMTIFNIFIIGILLLNFMIAILSTTYSNLLESGSFKFKCQVYNYCERFMIAMEEKKFGELVVHAPPLNLFCTFILPFCFLKGEQMDFVTDIFSKSIYWIENVLGVAVFFLAELAMLPLVFVKNLVTMLTLGPEIPRK